MFGIFKKKSPIDRLKTKHAKLLQEAFVLSKTNRSASDAKMAEAATLEKEIMQLENN